MSSKLPEMVTIGHIVKSLKNGLTVKQDPHSGGIPITRIETISDHSINSGKVGFADIQLGDKDSWLLEAGDILFSHINSVAHLGKCAIYEGIPKKLIHGMNLLNLRIDTSSALPKYVLYALRSKQFRHQIPKITKKSVNQASLSIASLRKLEIPLPPLSEQKRIADILDKADAIRRKQKVAVELADSLTQSIFYEMFGDPVTNPMGWKTGVLGDLIYFAKDGPHVSPKYTDDGIPFLSTRNIRPGKLIWEDLKFVSLEEAEKQWRRCKPEYGDILYTKGGTTGYAKCFDVDRDIAIWVHVALLKTNHELTNSFWLETMLNTEYCYSQSQQQTRGIVNRDLGLKRMVNIKLFTPPKHEQDLFEQRFWQVQKSLNKQTAATFLMDDLFNSLVQRAFKGEL